MTRAQLAYALCILTPTIGTLGVGCDNSTPPADGAIDAAIDGGPVGDGGGRDAGRANDAATPADAGGARDAGPPEPCASPGAVETVACGACGTIERFCTAERTWAYGVCAGEGECAPGATESAVCGSCGTQARRCTATCTWEVTGACTGEGECAPGTATRSGAGCPAGQTRDVLCGDACTYAPTSVCTVDTCSSPGAIEAVPCGTRCGTQERFCSAARVWEYGTCGGEGVCAAGSIGTAPCGRCGTRTTACDGSCAWVPFGACTGEEACCLPATNRVDLLFMIDNSNSMAEEQASLAAEIPRIVRALATGDVDGDGTAEFAPIASLQAGVVTSDMGTGGAIVPTCSGGTFGSRFGDDGVLITRGRTSLPGCSASYPAIQTFNPSAGDPDAFAASLSCVATTGTGGCGFEQQLEAVLKALSPAAPTSWTSSSFVAPTFFDGTTGHALSNNLGFIREDSLLVVVIVTDEEDCSARDPGIFDPRSSTYTSDLNLRCFTYPSALHPIARFVDGLAQLRTDPERLLISSIVGIPLAAEPTSVVPDYDAILAHPDMVERLDPSVPTRLVPSCNTARGMALPPRRILTMQRDLEARGIATTAGSICGPSFSGVTGRLLSRIAARLEGTCP